MAWDSTMRIVEHKTDEEMARIVYTRFTSGDTKDATKYSIGGLYVHPYVKYVSRKALANIEEQNPNIISKLGVEYAKMQVKAMGITREHTIPVAETYRYFKKLFDEGRLSEDEILGFMPKLFMAVITEEENKLFSKVHLCRTMPVGWWESKELDPLKRYRDAGLGDDIWAKF